VSIRLCKSSIKYNWIVMKNKLSLVKRRQLSMIMPRFPLHKI
jgi:hypothetical protein